MSTHFVTSLPPAPGLTLAPAPATAPLEHHVLHPQPYPRPNPNSNPNPNLDHDVQGACCLLQQPRRITPLDLPELLILISQYLSQREALVCILVCKAWRIAFEPVLWSHVETAYCIPIADMERHATEIRTLSLADLKMVHDNGGDTGTGLGDRVLRRCTRLEGLILWPDAFDDEEDEEDDDEDEDDGNDVEVDGNDGDNVDGMEFDKWESDESAEEEEEDEDVAVGGREMGNKEKEKVRRDSGVGEDTTRYATTSAEAGVQLLTIQETTAQFGARYAQPTPLSFGLDLKIPQQQQGQRLYSRPPSRLAKLLLRNKDLRRIEVYVGRKSPGGSFWRALAGPPPLPGCTLKSSSASTSASYSCPELQVLDWRVPRLGFPVQKFCEALQEGCWPKLIHLTLPESRLSDSELAEILTSIALPPASLVYPFSSPLSLSFSLPSSSSSSSPSSSCSGLVTFAVRRSDFGELSFKALRRHFPTLKYLDLCQCLGLSSWMAQEILGSCPMLESFEGYQIQARDIVQDFGLINSSHNSRNDNDTQQQQGWACGGLRYLDIYIAGFGSGTGFRADGLQMKLQWSVFAQLARLDKLVHLAVGDRRSSILGARGAAGLNEASSSSTLSSSPSSSSQQSHGSAIETGGLDMRLCSGLSQLSTLKQLRMLQFMGLNQQMAEKDVAWMAENLPELRVVQGRLHTDERRQEVLETQLQKSGQISAWTMYNQYPPCQSQPQQQ
ncbi:hypothetical protein BG011_003129 [Mortierella polycephala]|uniref:F-box domain-containing protein n=1 Tax=Mortierella polycephala TaxID=41804 RepID=A0A9P6QFQ5_9FUNG|nr:hypothetical protein BG011_003129 [Mortierella polycephala]